MSYLTVNEQMDLIRRGTEEILPEDDLVKKLERSRSTGKPLIVKLGCDPSRPDLHIGHGVVLRKLRHFQDLGHTAVLVIGDFTAMIGDPSGRNKTRPQLTLDEAKANAESYVEQAKAILDIRSVIIKYNSDWLNKMNFNDVVKLASSYTVARMLERDDFTKRFQAEVPISIHEFLYPLAQAQDSVELRADVELGGTDQKFNLLVGRDLQKDHGQEPQCIITTPLLEGTDGVEKMSKSYGNHIGLQDTPEDMYGKTLSISDDMILKWFTLAADADESVTKSVKKRLVDPAVNPMDVKRELARAVVALYYDDETATKAEDHFNTVVVGKGIPDDMPEYTLKGEDLIVNVLFDAGLLKSKGEARRMVKQGAVKLDGKPVDDIQKTLTPNGDQILKVGKRRFLKVTG
jgi:tyrosyl-tRNA synthetase